MEFRKMVTMTLYVSSKRDTDIKNRYKEQTFGLYGEGEGGMF